MRINEKQIFQKFVKKGKKYCELGAFPSSDWRRFTTLVRIMSYHGCNKVSKRLRFVNRKQNKWSSWQRATWQVENVERGPQKLDLIRQVVIGLSVQLVSATFNVI